MYRIIALDIDGTLLNDDHRLTDATRRSVREAHDRGADIVLCTGRGPANAVPIMEQLGLEGTVITHNGGVTIEWPDNVVVNQFTFSLATVHPLIDYARRKRLHVDVCTAFELFIERCDTEAARMYRDFLLSPTKVSDLKALETSIVKLTLFGPPERLDQVESDWPDLNIPLRLIRSGAKFIDIMLLEASKGAALRHLAGRLGVERGEILAMGNFYNDMEMIEYAGMGIAMANSPEAVIASADEVTLSNNEDGVAHALRKYVLTKS